jgi:hypothetical protein
MYQAEMLYEMVFPSEGARRVLPIVTRAVIVALEMFFGRI